MSWGKTDDDILQNPKVQALAEDLGIAEVVHLVGHLNVFWAAVRRFNEDGDLSKRPDDEIAKMAAYKGDPALFVRALEKRRFLDGRLVHDWLEYHGPSLVAKYKTHGRHKLVAIWALHGKEYGRKESAGEAEADDRIEAADVAGTTRELSGNTAGSEGEVQDLEVDLDRDQETKALSPQAQGEEETKSPNGGSGGKPAAVPLSRALGSSVFIASGLGAQGSAPPGDVGELSAAGVFAGLEPLLRFHGITTVPDLQRRADHCGVSPAYWTMVLMDKVHAAFRTDKGPAMVDAEDADPVAMTIGGLVPGAGGKVHVPTRAARQFFGELIQDAVLAKAGQQSRWNGHITPNLITTELGRRKGKGKRL